MRRSQLINIDDYRRLARRRLPRTLYDFVAGRALDGQTFDRNYSGFDAWWLRSRSFASCAAPDISVTIGRHRLKLPIMIAPTGCSGLLSPRGEVEAARAATDSGTLIEVSAGSILSIEEIGAAAGGAKWLQLFLYRDRGLTRDFLARAQAAGYTGIVVTTDAPVHGRREQDYRNGFAL